MREWTGANIHDYELNTNPLTVPEFNETDWNTKKYDTPILNSGYGVV